jgi:hypothetical protein
MFSSPIFDVTIGLIFIFLLYSLLATILNEFIATFFSYRARMLERGLEQMLDGKNYSYYWWDKVVNFFIWIYHYLFTRGNKPMTRAAFFEKGTVIPNITRIALNKKGELFASEITTHPLYKRSSQNGFLSKKPAYLPANVFSNILLDILKPDSGITPDLADITRAIGNKDSLNEDLRSILNIYIQQANGDIQRFRLIIEKWYDDTMERVSGWYKRQANRILFTLGLLLAVIFNVSTIGIVSTLSGNPKASEALATQATTYLKEHPAPDSTTASKSLYTNAQNDLLKVRHLYSSEIDSANNIIGAGWSKLWAEKKIPSGYQHYVEKAWCVFTDGVLNVKNLVGFIITALAISLGAPFWFDLLNKFVNLRAAGAKPNDPKNSSGSPSISDLTINQEGIRVVERNG